MKVQHNDGGRAAAGYKGSADDCVTRAVAIATERPYQEVYEEMTQRAPPFKGEVSASDATRT